jgi:hypothetical protein
MTSSKIRTEAWRPFALGVASGGRTTAGAAALALTAPVPNRRLRTATSVAAAGEWVVDKLPMTPSRLEPPGVIGRGAFGVGTAVLLARRRGESQPVAGVLGLAGAATGALLGSAWRAHAGKLGLTAFHAALGEDLLVAALAALACQP